MIKQTTSKNKLISIFAIFLTSLLLFGCSESSSDTQSSDSHSEKTEQTTSDSSSSKQDESETSKSTQPAKQAQNNSAPYQQYLANQTTLANANFAGQDEINVNNNNPYFSQQDLSTNKGAWQSFGNLDQLNRPTVANALINYSMKPHQKRERLVINPTGWHNKRIKSGWLYNRSHLIGYQLTGQNNNPKNLITGTRQLNAPEMLAHEDDIAYYVKQNPNHFVRYRVTPIFRGNELLARGVEMEGQSIGDNAIHFNTYIFNVQSGVTLNYADGTSRIGQ